MVLPRTRIDGGRGRRSGGTAGLDLSSEVQVEEAARRGTGVVVTLAIGRVAADHAHQSLTAAMAVIAAVEVEAAAGQESGTDEGDERRTYNCSDLRMHK